MQKNERFTSFGIDDDLKVRYAVEPASDGGSKIFKPFFGKSWREFFTISMADVKPWQDWHRRHILEGKDERVDATIEVLAADLRRTLARVDLEGVSPLRLEMGGFEENKEEVARFEVELSVEGIRLDLTP